MSEREILDGLIIDFPGLINDRYPFPEPYIGEGKIKAIVLGADPTHIIDGKPKPFQMVFGLDHEKPPYWNSIARNINHLENLSMSNIYVQNVCRNYFNEETSKNKYWVDIARKYWIKLLKQELDNQFSSEIPILMTTEFILHSCLIDQTRRIKAKEIYSNCLAIDKKDNLLSRDLLAFYRHPKYSLNNWEKYRKFISDRIGN